MTKSKKMLLLLGVLALLVVAYVAVTSLGGERSPSDSNNLSELEPQESTIEVTPLGISMLVNEEHQEKAYSPIEVTPLGISMLVNDEQPEKA